MAGASSMIDNLTPVSPFELSKYLGQWYEIARLPTWFEKDMSNVTANYSLRKDGKVKVENSGLKKGKFETAVGKAKVVESPNIGYLKVSFFGPFYADYKVFVLDTANYQYAMVASSYKYLWILCRQPTMEKRQMNDLVAEAQRRGFDTKQLIFTSQEHAGTPNNGGAAGKP